MYLNDAPLLSQKRLYTIFFQQIKKKNTSRSDLKAERKKRERKTGKSDLLLKRK